MESLLGRKCVLNKKHWAVSLFQEIFYPSSTLDNIKSANCLIDGNHGEAILFFMVWILSHNKLKETRKKINK